MALTNFDLLNIANTVINKDVEGRAFTASEFQSLLNAQSQMLFAEKLGLPQEYPLDAPLARMGAGKSRAISQSLRPFLKRETKTVSGGALSLASLSESVGYLLSIDPTSITGRGFDEVDADEYAYRMGSSVVYPTAKDPIFMWVGKDSVVLAPSTITSVSVTYYKYPDDAVISIATNSSTLLMEYDSSGSTELEWYDKEKIEIVYRILRDAGVNLERQDVTALGERVVRNG